MNCLFVFLIQKHCHELNWYQLFFNFFVQRVYLCNDNQRNNRIIILHHCTNKYGTIGTEQNMLPYFEMRLVSVIVAFLQIERNNWLTYSDSFVCVSFPHCKWYINVGVLKMLNQTNDDIVIISIEFFNFVNWSNNGT